MRYVPDPATIARVEEALLSATAPLKRDALAKVCGVSERKVRAAIARLVLHGQPIVSTGGGFKISRDPDELKSGARLLRALALSTIRRAAALERLAPARYAQQLLLDLDGAV